MSETKTAEQLDAELYAAERQVERLKEELDYNAREIGMRLAENDRLLWKVEDMKDEVKAANRRAESLASALSDLVNFPSPESRQRAVDLLTELDIPVYA